MRLLPAPAACRRDFACLSCCPGVEGDRDVFGTGGKEHHGTAHDHGMGKMVGMCGLAPAVVGAGHGRGRRAGDPGGRRCAAGRPDARSAPGWRAFRAPDPPASGAGGHFSVELRDRWSFFRLQAEYTFVFHADGLLFPQMAFANGAACTANNHVFDGLEEGAANLMAVLEGARIRHNGLHDRGTFAPLSLCSTRAAGLSADGIALSQIGSGPGSSHCPIPSCWKPCGHCVPGSRRPVSSCIPMTGTKVFPRLRIASGSGRTGLPPQGDIILFAPVIATAGSRPSRPRRARPSWPGDSGIFCSAATEAGGAGAMCACCPSVSCQWRQSACWLYGKTKNWQFSLYRMDVACAAAGADLRAGLPPSSASLRWKGTNRKRPMKDSGWVLCSCSGKIFRLCRACGRPGRTAARMRRWGRQEAWSTISGQPVLKKDTCRDMICPGSRTGKPEGAQAFRRPV